ncbi:Phosphoglycerate dehydrogenase [Verrucomicrobium sp. GAS474]|uniref:hydroxyacid dehydrogenase n=1 Tax=Verrucomicrobium sp. GAS474 TaxID=1882831 RepID=UPI000879842A|nr:hydroxyacid dehydrogenase [Verrucomicrobium sp. GAS474]SDT88537.1 Phosphoglycerate dehydrogenase [Verrucomicrobium sp. GAS474]
MRKPAALILLDRPYWGNVYGPAERKRLEGIVSGPCPMDDAVSLRERGGASAQALAEAEVVFGGWGMPRCDEAFLAAAPNLKAIFFAAGSVKGFVTDALWARGIVVSSANSVLAVTVAEFTLAQILLSLKLAWRHVADMRAARRPVRHPMPGIYDSVVGLISVGAVARHLIPLLRPFRVEVIAYDPFLSDAAAQALGVRKVSLEELFETAHVVSLHTPLLPETVGMIRGHHFARMRPDAAFINTARGAIVNERELIEVLYRRPDLHALLDVTHPEPPAPDSPLYTLPNVVLTPHIAGAVDGECRRLAAMAIDECERYLVGAPLHGQVDEEMMATIA